MEVLPFVCRLFRLQTLLGCEFNEMVDENYAVVNSANEQLYVRVLSTLNREDLKANCSIALHKHSHSIVEILPPEADSTVNSLAMTEKPNVTYNVPLPFTISGSVLHIEGHFSFICESANFF